MSNKIAYFISEEHKDEHGGYIPCFIAEGHTGYTVTSWNFGPDRDFAKNMCDEYNKAAGLSDSEVNAMLNRASVEGRNRSMFRR